MKIVAPVWSLISWRFNPVSSNASLQMISAGENRRISSLSLRLESVSVTRNVPVVISTVAIPLFSPRQNTHIR